MRPDIRGQSRRAFVGLVAAAIAVSLDGCSVTPAATHWQRLELSPAARVVADYQAAVRILRPTDLPETGGTTVKIDHSDPAIRTGETMSYVKIFRFQAKSPGTYEVRARAWCDCPWTAILWGSQDFTIFYPTVVVLDRAGNNLVVNGKAELHRPVLTTERLAGLWNVTLSDIGPYYVLVTSHDSGPKELGALPGSQIGQSLVSSPVGKIEISVKLVMSSSAPS
jgi:hypothetical protein